MLTSRNHFEIFALPVSFQVALEDLEEQYRKLQADYHPDRFTSASEKDRVQALQSASLINDAYETLKSPLKRAAYLLKLKSVDPEEHNQSHLEEGFLLRQMELRETLENLVEEENIDGLEALKFSAEKDKQSVLESFESSYNSDELNEAKSLYNQLQFLYKLTEEVDRAEEKLLDY